MLEQFEKIRETKVMNDIKLDSLRLEYKQARKFARKKKKRERKRIIHTFETLSWIKIRMEEMGF